MRQAWVVPVVVAAAVEVLVLVVVVVGVLVLVAVVAAVPVVAVLVVAAAEVVERPWVFPLLLEVRVYRFLIHVDPVLVFVEMA